MKKKYTDEKLLKALRPILVNPPLRQVAKKLNIDITGVYRALKRLEKEGKVKHVGIHWEVESSSLKLDISGTHHQNL